MSVNIDQLIIDELLALNHRIVERIKHAQSHLDIMTFNLKARVSFDSQYGRHTGHAGEVQSQDRDGARG
jgi:hypothetical protein